MARRWEPARAAPPAERVSAFRGALLEWFDRNKRDLPWRRTRDPYAIWISEVMLQQTQVATVVPYWTRFLERFPTVQALARAKLPDVFAAWRGLGYYSRARNLHAAAREIAARGGLPKTARELLELPGFGRYPAGAVASIAFGDAAPVVDGNVARALSRVFVVEGAPGDRARERALWELAEVLVHGERPGDWNQALMELGATVCRPDPACGECPVRSSCGAFAAGRVSELPPARRRPDRKRLEMAVAVWRRGSRVLLARRDEGGLFGGLWELPCVEATARAAVPALVGLMGRGARVGVSLGEVRRTLTHRDLVLRLYEVDAARVPRRLDGYSELKWATPAATAKLGMSTAMSRALALAAAK